MFISKFIPPALTAITASPCRGCSGAWAPLSAPCPAPAAAGWPGSESGVDTSATPPHYSLHCPGPRTLHQPSSNLPLILGLLGDEYC